MDKLLKCEANYAALSPITFLPRAAAAYADRTSIIYERTHFTWKQTYERCCLVASSFRSLFFVQKNDVVSVLAPNIPALYEMHFAVPMAGAILNTINTRLDASNIATILKHSEAKVFLVDYQYTELATAALSILSRTHNSPLPRLIAIDDLNTPTGLQFGELDYEDLVTRGDPFCPPYPLHDEWDSIALNYTSGTTSAPKGVVYSHRAAFLSTMSLLLQWGVGAEPVYLWTLPMFHCNGWTFTWGMAAKGGANVCIRAPTAENIYKAIAAHGVTHMCCAPVIFNIILEAPLAIRKPLLSAVHVLTGGAPPPAALLEKIERLNFHITHAYGLTEATGPALVCEWREQWNRLPFNEQAKLKARQGVGVLTLSDVDVKDVKTMQSVPRDGATVGEIVLKGSGIMKGYYKDPEATKAAFKNGSWFMTGDVGVVHPDGYIEIKDRSKDVIISGGENISSVEVEAVLYRHPMVLEAAVVAMPHQKWGETPCAFVALKKEYEGNVGVLQEEDIMGYCMNNMAKFMVPKKVVFMPELPKNGNGKIVKFLLREKARSMVAAESAAGEWKVNGGSGGGGGGGGQGVQENVVMAMSRL